MKIKEISFSSIHGIKVGHSENAEAATGCTVILSEDGAVAGVDVRGGAPGTRETDLLNPINLVDQVHGILLAGGSAYGLDAASGVMKYLEEKQIGFDVTVAKIPIVPAAVLFDLAIGDASVRPDLNMGYDACLNATTTPCLEGAVGAGTGATIGKILGNKFSMKGGLGTFALQIGDLQVGAIVAVNCLGDVIDPKTNEIIAGCYNRETKSFLSTENIMIEHYEQANRTNLFNGNTTIGVIATNAKLVKAQANKIASMAQNGFARTMRPAHTMVDGDTIFAIGTGETSADTNVIGLLAARCMEQAVINAIQKTTDTHGLPSYQSIQKPLS